MYLVSVFTFYCVNVDLFQGKSCMLVAGDVYRPAAIDQLSILGEQVIYFVFPTFSSFPRCIFPQIGDSW